MSETEQKRALPLFIVKKGTISPKDMRRAERLARIVIVESTEPDQCRLVEPPPDADVPEQARAALKLFRYVLDHNNASFYKADLTKWFVDLILKPMPPPVQKVTKK